MSLATRLAAAAIERGEASPPAPAGQHSGRTISRREGYSGARLSRLEMDWVVSSLPADETIRMELRRLRARSRDLAANTPMGRHYRNLLTVNVVGPTGMKMQARNMVDGALSEKVNAEIERAWRAWCRGKITVDRRLNFLDFQNLAIKTLATDGEVFVRLWRNFDGPGRFALQIIDADLVDESFHRERSNTGNEIRMGIEVDALGAPVAYHVLRVRHYNLPTAMTQDRVRIPADQILHLYVQERPGQTRGVPWFAPIMARMKMLDGYTEAELVAARTGAAKMGFIQAKDGAVVAPSDPEQDGQPKQALTMEGNPGTIEQLEPGWEFQAWDPTHPSGAFGDFVKAISRDIASGLGVSYNAFANDLEGVNYSSMRSGLLIERDLWRALQMFWIGNLLQMIGAEWLNMGLLSRTIVLPLGGTYDEIDWIARGWAWVDPLKETQAAVLGIANGLGSRTHALAEQGDEIEQVFRELEDERRLAKKYGVELADPNPPVAAAGDVKKKDEPPPDDEPADE